MYVRCERKEYWDEWNRLMGGRRFLWYIQAAGIADVVWGGPVEAPVFVVVADIRIPALAAAVTQHITL